MKLRLVFLGKTRNPHLRALIEDYRRRLAHYAPLELVEWKSTEAGPAVLGPARGKSGSGLVVLLDAAGRSFTSQEFAGWIARQLNAGPKQIVFLLGGAEGFPEESKRQADLLLSLSPLTLPHELARVLLLEQLYRAFALLREHPYPK